MQPRQVLLRSSALAVIWLVAATLHADPSVNDRYILLNNGRVMAGQVSQDAQGYMVVGRNGRIHAPYEYVRLVADTLHDVYRQQRDARPEPVTVQDRLDLARWCISYSLYDEARLELKQVLRGEPQQAEARQMLKKLAEILRPDTSDEQSAPTRTLDGYLVPQAESLGSLSKDAAATFTAKVQPILVNKCGNARCHGVASENAFRLVHVRSGVNSHRIHTERNLAALSPYLDLQHPADSPLLAIPRGSHGGGASVFGGAGGERQFDILREWVYSVARERGGYRDEPAVEPAEVEPVASADGIVAEAETRPVPAGAPEGYGGPSAGSGQNAGTTPASGRDPFDPEVFNALVHGGALPRAQ